jgi:phosphatidate phosphatase APP1
MRFWLPRAAGLTQILGRKASRVPPFTATALLLAMLSLAVGAHASELKPDEEIVFFPGLGWQVAGGEDWEVEIHGMVCEPSRSRQVPALLRKALELDDAKLTRAESARFSERVRLFMVDHERGKRVVARVAGQEYELEKTPANGQFSRLVSLPQAAAEQGRSNLLHVSAVLPGKDARSFFGDIHLWERAGLTVISDIDDTIKITEVTDRRALLRNTFLEPFRPVPGMAQVYQGWATSSNARFCYVSASPWQLYEALQAFAQSNGFPAGVFYLKDFRWRDQTFFNLFKDPVAYKTSVIEPLLQRFPGRRFVLVGDSGEQDPEIYAALARKYPKQVARVCIRDVTGGTVKGKRYQALFRDLPEDLLVVFRHPASLAPLK